MPVRDSQDITLTNWRVLGLSSLGAPISVDSATPLRPDGEALFKPVWTQMCFQ